MTAFKRINNIVGWLVFIVAATTYMFTMEPTVSLWDCGEFIAAAAKLEVGHPPGAPFYLMLARIFALFAPDKSYIAVCINSLSALASAFTVLFLFWTITHLARKIMIKDDRDFSVYTTAVVLGSGIVGSLAFCFSDSFWFSAAEAEVYALSSLFTALVFWCILKWEEDKSANANRWIVLIAYLMGMSIGVHLLNLLAIPAIVFIYYSNKYGLSRNNITLALIASFVILLGVLYVIIPGTVKLASFFEVLVVNQFHFPVNTGLALFVILMAMALLIVAWISHARGRVFLNTSALCVLMILIGYSSYAMIVIRAQVNVPINTGKPSNAFSLLSYLNRDQYGNRPLIYGQYYNAPQVQASSTGFSYVMVDGKFEKSPARKEVVYDSRFMTFFPRMYSSSGDHAEVYKNWGTVKGVPIKVKANDGSEHTVMKPTFIDNLEFFFKYQVGYMYLRYFMWNFAGKQNDMQGNGGIFKGNWISGFDFIDKWFIGPQQALPDYMKNNPGKNRYYLLPLLLGVCGLVFHFSRSRSYFGVVMLLFLLTGLAIVIYTNQTPLQPRERDYVYVGSFYAFCIWIGIGVLSLFKLLVNRISIKFSVCVAIALGISVPTLMFAQNIDDHNRARRYIVRDIARNYLNSCATNAILFTVGDNDTYPLWYLQEVEGVRTDVRVVNLMLLTASWYIDQQKQRAYLSDPLPVSLPQKLYAPGVNSWLAIRDSLELPLDIRKALESINPPIGKASSFMAKDYLPTRRIVLPVNKGEARKSGAIAGDLGVEIPDSVYFTLPGGYILKNELIVMDILAHFDWKRPVYFNLPGYKGTLGLDNHLRLEGFTYRLVPGYCQKDNNLYGCIDTDILFHLLMNTSEWSTEDKGRGLMDDHVRNMLAIMRVRQNYGRLALELCNEGKLNEAELVLDRVMRIMPPAKIPYDQYCIGIAEAYFKANAKAKAARIVKGYKDQLLQEVHFYKQLSPMLRSWTGRERSLTQYYLDTLNSLEKNMYGIR
ncbi:MAG TPA: DUF2723 domain-containing protein [Bacteroidales bacterium]|nr:DUF2723 domain-containing protein [Bacteroidales bacterium]